MGCFYKYKSSDQLMDLASYRTLISWITLCIWGFLCIRDAGRRGNKITEVVGRVGCTHPSLGKWVSILKRCNRSATKLVETLHPKGPFWHFTDFKRWKWSLPPPSPPCNVVAPLLSVKILGRGGLTVPFLVIAAFFHHWHPLYPFRSQ